MALEFLMLFPFVVAMLYAAAVYGIVFFSQYRMQSVVDRAVATALYVDRSAYSADELKNEVEDRAGSVLEELLRQQPEPLGTMDLDGASCKVVEDVAGVTLLRCGLTYNYEESPIVPAMSFGMLGTFPPVPATLTAEARAAF